LAAARNGKIEHVLILGLGSGNTLHRWSSRNAMSVQMVGLVDMVKLDIELLLMDRKTAPEASQQEASSPAPPAP